MNVCSVLLTLLTVLDEVQNGLLHVWPPEVLLYSGFVFVLSFMSCKQGTMTDFQNFGNFVTGQHEADLGWFSSNLNPNP
jgi:hypothetical protein